MDNVNITVNETIENVVVNPSITTEVIDVNITGTTETINIDVTPNLTTVNINSISGSTVTKTSDLINDGEDGVHPFITIEDVPTPTNGLPIGGTAGQILTKIDSVDYNATWQENYADWTSVVKHTVKNNGLSGTITKGTAVYVTGSNGTNMLVGRASNVSESTSSKTMGLMQTDITTIGTNQTGFVIAEGLIQGLNTAGQTAGDPIWLGVNGALIYGLINKPFAPSHLVFIGIVTKVSAGNGEIFVKVQNGFELKEIHDVDVITTTPINGHILGFDGTLWVNKTVAGWLGFTPGTVTSVSALTLGTTGTDLSSTVANGTTTPVITLNVPTASATNRGALSTTDWTAFNGKFTLPSLTSGSVLFSDGTTIAQKNSNFFWDNTNNRLGIGTNVPTANLHIKSYGALSTDIALRVRNSADTIDLMTINGIGNVTIKAAMSESGNAPLVIQNLTPYSSPFNQFLQIWKNSAGTTLLSLRADGSLDQPSVGGISSFGFTSNKNGAANAPVITRGDNYSTGIFFPAIGTLAITSNFIEALRITSTQNLLINTTTDNGGKLQIKAPGALSTDIALRVRNSADTTDSLKVDGTGTLSISSNAGTTTSRFNFFANANTNNYAFIQSRFGGSSNFGRLEFGTLATGVTAVKMTLDESGCLILGTSNVIGNASAVVDLVSTTKGFLPPRMTNAQRIAIATPAVGLCVYCTDVVEGLYINKSTGWTFIG